MSLREILLGFALLVPCAAAAADLHQQPAGTRVSGEFRLGPSTFYLPEGEWVLAATHAWTGTLGRGRAQEGPRWAGVFLFDLRGQQVARALWVISSITPVPGTVGWLPESDPCKKREDVYLHRELGENYQNQYCVEVNHRVPFLVERKGWVERAHGWLVDSKVPVPQTMVAVQYARIDRAYQTQMHYYFNPELDGLAPGAGKWGASEWHRDRVARDPARAAYLETLARWAGEAAPPVYAGLTDAKLKPAFPQPPFPAKR
jgi:hypothetical protein